MCHVVFIEICDQNIEIAIPYGYIVHPLQEDQYH